MLSAVPVDSAPWFGAVSDGAGYRGCAGVAQPTHVRRALAKAFNQLPNIKQSFARGAPEFRHLVHYTVAWRDAYQSERDAPAKNHRKRLLRED
jgi:hypothetical protein